MTQNVYQLIAAVSAEIAINGIAKGRKNAQQGYSFRGIDDVFNVLAPIMSKHGLVILPRMLTRESHEKTTAKGGVLFYTVIEAEFDFVSAHDGSKHTIRTYGEAMDSADKSSNKAMSAAYKYAALQTFCIPTEADNDADATTYVVKSSYNSQATIDKWTQLAEQAETIDQLMSCRKSAAEEFKSVNDVEGWNTVKESIAKLGAAMKAAA